MFTLKVIKNEFDEFVSYSKHPFGGIDTTQRYAFRHLFPQDYCPWGFDELLYEMAMIHGWKVEIIKEKDCGRSKIR